MARILYRMQKTNQLADRQINQIWHHIQTVGLLRNHKLRILLEVD
ncbi:MAG: hypothetical protein DDT31_01406 [Syntrophomonadaceae bacterium]|nr:hypothetical protein [Bacillota bacterium]